MHDAALNVPPGIYVATADDDDIDRYPKVSKLARKPNRLLSLVLDLRLNDQEVEVAALARIAPSMRTEQHDLGRLASRARQPSASLLDHSLLDHAETLARMPERQAQWAIPTGNQALVRTRTGDPVLTMDVLYQLSYEGARMEPSARADQPEGGRSPS